MIKRISTIAILTGAGQLLAIFALKYISQHGTAEELKSMGEADSLVQFIISLIAAGLQSVAMRNIALATDWHQEYLDTQSARLSFGILLAAAGVFGLVKGNYLIFLIAPLLALSGDYALYGLGHPVAGATVALLRVAVPYSLVIVAARYWPGELVAVYVGAVVVVYAITNLFISWYLRTPWFILPRFRKLLLYLNSLALGIVNLSIYFLGLGLLLVVPYFYHDNHVIAVAFVGLKVYVIYKGVLRIVHQAFLKDMIKDSVQLQVDQLSILLGLCFAGSAIIFPVSFTNLLFGSKYAGDTLFFQLMAVAALIYSLFLSMSTNVLLQRKDRKYAAISAAAVLVTTLAVAGLATIRPRADSLGISLCLGETFWMAGLLWVSASATIVRKRITFLLPNLAMLVVPVLCRYFFGDSPLYWFCGFGGFAIILLILHLKKFLLLASA
jgi:O-antigen/teichoic acid export membrane protein